MVLGIRIRRGRRDLREYSRSPVELGMREFTAEVNMDARVGEELKRLVLESIRLVLGKRGLYDPRKVAIVISPNRVNLECNEEVCHYSARYEVHDVDGSERIAYGVAFGTADRLDEYLTRVHVRDITVSMNADDMNRLKTYLARK